ncbi:MAG TPA: hypothetical protein VKP11_09940, partial [Frankiaceae bacterium]|nr:hypothetical protein [Frankiaceae bacterium]
EPAEAAAAADFIGTEEVSVPPWTGGSTGGSWGFGGSRGATVRLGTAGTAAGPAERTTGQARAGPTAATTGDTGAGPTAATTGDTGQTPPARRAERHVVQARDLRAAAQTGLYLVAWTGPAGAAGRPTTDERRRQVWFADCDPLIAAHPGAPPAPGG